ncbi:hypothetical protein MTR72_15750 [Bradyrhizobium sp. ISRA442]|uniref:alpha/beta hydrolase family protein n=1 Tax=Bradyrhizobium sp. ISRA442 TaxID=2866197 RepID=UPI00311B2E5A
MLCAAWPHTSGNFASIRLRAAAFLDSLEDARESNSEQEWAAQWANIGDAHCVLVDVHLKKRDLAAAADAWLCALTAFEVGRRLVDEDHPQGEKILAKIYVSIQRFALSLGQKVEQVRISCDDLPEISAYYLSQGGADLAAPAVICISREGEARAALLGRLLPAVSGRAMSILVVSHDDVSNHWRGRSEISLSCCLDYLAGRAGVDASRIGIYGEGLSAALATDYAVFDRRIAAAVCDGGLWNWVCTLGSGWPTRALDNESEISARRSRLARQLRCPVLVVAGGRGTVSVPEAIKLQADCVAARIDLEIAMPRTAPTPVRDIENFITSDDHILGWLERKLTASQLRDCRLTGEH